MADFQVCISVPLMTTCSRIDENESLISLFFRKYHINAAFTWLSLLICLYWNFLRVLNCQNEILQRTFKFNFNHFYISFLVNPSSKLSNEKLKESVNNLLMESVKRWYSSVTVKETGKAAVIAVYIKNFLKENNLVRVKNIFITADLSIITTKYKQKLKKTITYCQ